MARVLQEAWEFPFSTKSNTAREHADEVAALASEGLITTLVGTTRTRTWKITAEGLRVLSIHLQQ